MSVANVVDSRVTTQLPARYQVGERLGAGASGETFAAFDTTTDTPCVVKLFADGSRGRRFALAEFRGLETLAHPSVVHLRDIGRLDDGRLYLVTDRVVGPGIEGIATIADEGERRALFVRAALDLASALAHLHARGIVHGDVCPANVRMSAAGGGPPRAVLIDFGLAGPAHPGDGAARGTLGYAAPEALTGARTPAADLFGLGATLFEAWSGTAPFGRGLRAAERVLTGPAPPLSSVRPGLDPAWDGLLDRLLAADPVDRPAHARLVLREVTRLAAGAATPTEVDLQVPYPEGDPLAGLFVGRRVERAALRATFERLAEGAAPAAALALVGPPGSGRRTLFEVAARDAAVAVAAGALGAIEIWRGDVAALEQFVGAVPPPRDDDARRAVEARMAALAEAIEVRARARPLCLLLDEGAASESLAAFVAGAAPTGRTLLVVPTRAPIGRPFAAEIALAPLTPAEIKELVTAGVDEEPPVAALAAVTETSRGNAALATLLARRLIANLRAGNALGPIDATGDLDGLLKASLASLTNETQRLLLAVALIDDDGAEAAALDEEQRARALTSARAAGWIELGAAGELRLPSAAHRRVVLASLPAAISAEVGARVLLALDTEGPRQGDALRRADALAVCGRSGEAAEVLRNLAATANGAGDHARAAGLLERVAALAAGSLTFSERLELATGLGAIGRYDDAAQVLASAQATASGPAELAAGCEREAWLLARRGDLDSARRALERGLAESEAAGLSAARLLRARLGRLLVTAGRFAEALAIVEPALAAASSAVDADAALALARETALLASAYLGEHARARELLAALGNGVGETRRAYLDGLLAQLAGDEGAAREAYRRAYEIAAGENDLHTVAAVALNLGGLLIEEGLYGEALTASARAVRELGRLGATAELVPALVNAANLFVELGDLAAARRALDRALGLGAEGRASRAQATASFVEGDLARRRGEIDAAVRHYRRSAGLFNEVGQPSGAASASVAIAETLAGSGRLADGKRALLEAEQLRPPGTATGRRSGARPCACRPGPGRGGRWRWRTAGPVRRAAQPAGPRGSGAGPPAGRLAPGRAGRPIGRARGGRCRGPGRV